MQDFLKRPAFRRGLVILLILVHFVLAFSSARLKSPTADEYTYIATGYLYLQTSDLRLDRTHPPLIRYLIGIPLQFMDVWLPPLKKELWSTPASYTLGYRIGWEMLLAGKNEWESILLAARLPIILLSCGLAFLIFWWARDLYGNYGAYISLFLYCFSPNILAHARLATLDLGISLLFAGTLFSFYLYWKFRTNLSLCLTGIFLGCALAAKLTAILLIPIIILAFAWTIKQEKHLNEDLWKKEVIKSIAVFALAIGCLFLVYGFPLKPFYYFDTMANVFGKSIHGGAGGEDIPGMPHRNYAFYLFGDYSTEGWPYYYLAAMLVKTPLPIFIMLVLILIFGKKRWFGFADILIVGGMIVLHVAAVFNRVNIGLRHILPVYPLLFLYLGRLIHVRESKFLRWGIIFLAIVYFGMNIWIYPDYLAYFNVISGGPDNAQNLLDDSNIDWGQDLGRLHEIQKHHPHVPFYVATNWMFVPQAFYLDAKQLKEEDIASPPKGIVAVGKHWAVRQRMHKRSPYYYDWFEKYESFGNVGHSILLYRFE